MIKIQNIQDTISKSNRVIVKQIKEIIRRQLPNESEKNIKKIRYYLQNPTKYRFRAMRYISEDFNGTIQGFVLLLHFSDLSFCLLDYLVTKTGNNSEGLMEALYRRAREDAIELKVRGVFIEAGPDSAELCSDPDILKKNIEDLKFYKLMGARPVIKTKYETPISPNKDNAPYLLYDDPGKTQNLPLGIAKKNVRAILEQKYGDIANHEYISTVINSFRDDTVKLRVYQYRVWDEYVFPIRNLNRIPSRIQFTAGYYCIDFFTPINKNFHLAAKKAVDCALTGAQNILHEQGLAYALVRPPGHHAAKKHFGGFCYFNSASITANYLSKQAKVAILDLDFHHGNGTQNIFYSRGDVLTISIHRDPQYGYSFFAGFDDETGKGKGKGYNINYPLGKDVDGSEYLKVLMDALNEIIKFKPGFLVVAFGLDTSKGEPNGTWNLEAADFEKNDKIIGKLKLPSLFVQEGGYNTYSLGVNAKYFLWDFEMGCTGNLFLVIINITIVLELVLNEFVFNAVRLILKAALLTIVLNILEKQQ